MATHALIIAGGSATRLWPATRRARPKQFQALVYGRPLIVETFDRLVAIFAPENIHVVTSADHEQMTAELLPGVPRENVVGEPVGRNTFAAIALGGVRVSRRDPDATVAFFPADHYVGEPERLRASIRHGLELARTRETVLLGIRPTEPSTGYGYIKLGAGLGERERTPAYEVERFVEKPDRARAEAFLAEGGYLWNAGMFVWRAESLRELCRRHQPGAWESLERVDAALDRGFKHVTAYEEVPSLQVDYAIVEKPGDRVVVEASCGWRDLGDWAALYEALEKDGAGNAASGEHLLLETRGTLVQAAGNKLVATIGLEDLIVVDTEDALFIAPRSRAQDVRRIVEQLRARGRHSLL